MPSLASLAPYDPELAPQPVTMPDGSVYTGEAAPAPTPSQTSMYGSGSTYIPPGAAESPPTASSAPAPVGPPPEPAYNITGGGDYTGSPAPAADPSMPPPSMASGYNEQPVYQYDSPDKSGYYIPQPRAEGTPSNAVAGTPAERAAAIAGPPASKQPGSPTYGRTFQNSPPPPPPPAVSPSMMLGGPSEYAGNRPGSQYIHHDRVRADSRTNTSGSGTVSVPTWNGPSLPFNGDGAAALLGITQPGPSVDPKLNPRSMQDEDPANPRWRPKESGAPTLQDKLFQWGGGKAAGATQALAEFNDKGRQADRERQNIANTVTATQTEAQRQAAGAPAGLSVPQTTTGSVGPGGAGSGTRPMPTLPTYVGPGGGMFNSLSALGAAGPGGSNSPNTLSGPLAEKTGTTTGQTPSAFTPSAGGSPSDANVAASNAPWHNRIVDMGPKVANIYAQGGISLDGMPTQQTLDDSVKAGDMIKGDDGNYYFTSTGEMVTPETTAAFINGGAPKPDTASANGKLADAPVAVTPVDTTTNTGSSSDGSGSGKQWVNYGNSGGGGGRGWKSSGGGGGGGYSSRSSGRSSGGSSRGFDFGSMDFNPDTDGDGKISAKEARAAKKRRGRKGRMGSGGSMSTGGPPSDIRAYILGQLGEGFGRQITGWPETGMPVASSGKKKKKS